MKNTKSLVVILLVVLMVFGAFSLLLTDEEDVLAEYDAAIVLAEDYMKRGLYQLAIMEYNKAIAVNDSESLRDSVLDAYEKRYAESTKILDAYISAANEATLAFPTNEKYYTVLAMAHCRNDDYRAAYKSLLNAKINGVNSEDFNKFFNLIKYSFEIEYGGFSEFLPCVSGFYAVSNSENWAFMDENGSLQTQLQYQVLSRVGEEGIRVLCLDDNILEDSEEIVRGKLSFVPEEAGVYSEGYITLKKDNLFGYYDSLGDYKFGKFIAASSFNNGRAAVSAQEGVWHFIETTGEKVDQTTYQDVKINLDGSYIKNGIFLAKTNGKYKIFDISGNRMGSFECDDVDVVTDDGLMAYELNGKWGFVNTAGEVIIQNRFDNAKSFSNGLAAVCVDGKWGFIDSTGQIVIECQFFDADYFNGEMNCLVQVYSEIWQLLKLRVDF